LFEREFNNIVCIGEYQTKIIVEWEFLFFSESRGKISLKPYQSYGILMYCQLDKGVVVVVIVW